MKEKLKARLLFLFMTIVVLIPYVTPIVTLAETMETATVQLKKVTLENNTEKQAVLDTVIDNQTEQTQIVTINSNQNLKAASDSQPMPQGSNLAINGTQLKVTVAPKTKVDTALKVALADQNATGEWTFSYQEQTVKVNLPEVVKEEPVQAEPQQTVTEQPEVTEETSQPQTTATEKQKTDETQQKTSEAVKDDKKTSKSTVAPKAAKAPIMKAQANAAGRDITKLPGNEKLATSDEGKTIFNDATMKKDGKDIDGAEVAPGDSLVLEYYFDSTSIPNDLSKNIKAGDYFNFKLPEQFKITNAPQKGTIKSPDGKITYATYTIEADGTVNMIFTDEVAKGSNFNGSLGATVQVDKEHVTKPGKEPIKIPFVDGNKTITPDIKIPDEETLDKEWVPETTSKDTDIKDNKGNITWKLTANKSGFPMTNGVLTDSLPKGVSFKDGSVKVLKYKVSADRNSLEGSGTPVTIDAPAVSGDPAKGQKIDFKLPDVKEGESYAYVVTFDTEVDFDVATVTNVWGTSAIANVTNNAVLNSEENKDVKAKSTKTFGSGQKMTKTTNTDFGTDGYQEVTPTAENKNAKGVISWKVSMTKDGIDFVPGTKITDVMVNMDNLTDEKGVPLSEAQIAAKLQEQFNAGGKNAGKTLNVTKQADGKYTFTFPEGVSDSFDMIYYSSVSEQPKVKNTATWNSKDSSKEFEVPGTSTGVKDYIKDRTDPNFPNGKPKGVDDGEVTWFIEVNKEFVQLDNWYVEDKLVNNKVKDQKIEVRELKTTSESWTNGKTMVEGTDYKVTWENDGSYRVDFLRPTNLKYQIRYTGTYDKDSQDPVSNDFFYHYKNNGKEWSTDGSSKFNPKDYIKDTITGAKKGVYRYDSETGEDKVDWTITINDNNTAIGPNASLYDAIPDGQKLDTSVEPELTTADGTAVAMKKSFTYAATDKTIQWAHWKAGDPIWKSPFFSVAGTTNKNGILTVAPLPEGSTDTYVLTFTTILDKKLPKDAPVNETVTNTANYKDGSHNPLKVTGETSFTRNAKTIDKVGQQRQGDKDHIDYTITLNNEKKKLSNVKIEDSQWINMVPDVKTLKIVDSTGAVIPTSDYEIDLTSTQLFITFKKDVTDEYTITYTGNLQYTTADLGNKIKVSNNVKITGDNVEGGTKDETDGFDAEVPSTGGKGDIERGGITIHKVDGDDDHWLANAMFTLYGVQDSEVTSGKWAAVDDNQKEIPAGHPVQVAINEDTNKPDVITKDVMSWNGDLSISSQDNPGEVALHWLPLGMYFLVETGTPKGYTAEKAPDEMLVNGETVKGWLLTVDKAVAGRPGDKKDPSVWDQLTVKNDKETTKINVTKDWQDAKNQDGLRPDSIDVQLVGTYKDAKGQEQKETKTVTLNEANNWSYEWKDLPTYKLVETDKRATEKAGFQSTSKITYAVNEVKVPDGYTSEVANKDNDYTITNSHTPEKIKIEGTKTWADAENQDGKRPASITVNLLADGTKVASKTVAEKDGWKYSFADLDKYKDGKEIKYTIDEETVAGYEKTVTGTDLTNTHTPEVTKVEGVKTWEDNNDQDGKRPTTIKVNLLADGTKIDSKDVAGPDWKYSFENLPKYKDGKEIKYTIDEEAVAGYTKKIDGFNLSNSHTPEVTTFDGEKIWVDSENQDGKRPSEITVRLMNGEKEAAKTTAKAPDWKFSFKDVAKYENGKEIQYTIVEDAVEGYSTKVEGNKITNTYSPEKTHLEGEKVWKDNNNQDGKRPETITINLLADGKRVDSQTISKAENWQYSFKDLPKFKDGKAINYTIEEVKVPGYQTVMNGNTIENTYTPEVVEFDGTKTWSDNNNQDGKRPESITINLLADGKKVASKQVTEKDNWQYSFTNMPKFKDGKEIKYTVTEDAVAGYEAKVDGMNVTNTHKPEETTFKVSKKWEDKNNQDGVRPTTIKVQLMADGKDYGEVVELSEKDNWTYEWTKLPANSNDNGKSRSSHQVIYTAKEVDTDKHYQAIVTPSSKANDTVITNQHTPEITKIEGKKTWDDKDNQDGKRPDKITVNLLADGEKVASQEVTGPDWTYSFDELDKFKDGKEINYTIDEEAVAGYTKAVDGNNLTNSYTPEVTKITGTKTWDDKDNQDGTRPDSIIVNLLADGEKVASKTVTEKDNWIYNFDNLPKFKEGKEIVYTIDEEAVAGYEKTVNGLNLTNTHTPEVTNFKVNKTWDDADNQDGVRPEAIKVQLKADGKAIGAPVELTEKDNWSYTWSNLPKNANPDKLSKAQHAIVYTAEEINVDKNYTAKVDTSKARSNGTVTITNRHTPEVTELKGKKTWDDKDNQDGKRPTSIKVNLLADGQVVQTKVVTEKDNWVYEFTKLAKFKAGTPIKYTVTEETVAGYKAEVKSNNIINTYTPGKTEVRGNKTWKDNDNQYKTRPNAIKVNLLADGKVVETKEVTEKDNWSYSFTNLDQFKAGKEIKYTIEEVKVPGYQSKVSGHNLTNTLEATEVSGKKIWNDKNDQDKLRPGMVTIALIQKGKQIATTKASVQSDWQYSFKNLPKVDENGHAYEYLVKELNVPKGYTANVNGFNITNTHKPNEPKTKKPKTKKPTRRYPKTNDIHSNTATYIGLGIIGAGGLIIGLKNRKKEDEETK